MPGLAEQPEGARGRTSLGWTIGMDYLWSNLGRFSLMPVLGLILADSGDGAQWVATGVGLFLFMLSVGLSALLVASWLPLMTYRTSMTASVAISAASFGILGFVDTPWLALSALLVAGFGISVHAVVVRVLIAEFIPDGPGRNNLYSIQQIGTNIAAAAGPFIAAALYVEGGSSRPLLLLVAGAYVAAALSLLVGVPREGRPPSLTENRDPSKRLTLSILRDREARRTSIVTMVGTFAYAQFYSSVTLLVGLTVSSTFLRGAFIGGPALAIAVFQTVATILMNRALRSGVQPLTILILGTGSFGVGIAALGLGLPLFLGLILAVSLFAVAEMIFTPMVSTSFNQITSIPRLAASSLQAVSWTTGEALGSLAGGSLFLLAWYNGVSEIYWLTLSLLTVTFAVVCWLTRHPKKG